MKKFAMLIFTLGIVTGLFGFEAVLFIQEEITIKKYYEFKQFHPDCKREWFDAIIKECERNGIEEIEVLPGDTRPGYVVIGAIAKAESNWKTGAYSDAGARGIMQVMAKHHLPKRTDPKVLYDPIICIQYGVKIFADNLISNKGNFIKSLSMYERGNGKVLNVDYVAKVWENLYKEI
jgi:hypothetical protein